MLSSEEQQLNLDNNNSIEDSYDGIKKTTPINNHLKMTPLHIPEISTTPSPLTPKELYRPGLRDYKDRPSPRKAANHKNKGNALFKDKKFPEAMREYNEELVGSFVV